MKRIICFFSLLCIFSVSAFGQVNSKYYPVGKALDSIPFLKDISFKPKSMVMPFFNLERQEREDKKSEGLNVPYRFGYGFDVSYTLNDGQWIDCDNGRIWSMSFTSSDALSLNFVLDNLCLADECCLYVTNEDRTFLYGPVIKDAVPDKGLFLTDLIPGECATFFLYEPTEQRGKCSLEIKKVVHGYREAFSSTLYGQKGVPETCYNDVVCFPEYEKESNAVALVLLADGTESCSGSLLMSTDFSFNPYFLTAFHCVDENEDGVISVSEKALTQSWLFKFKYKKSSCNGNSYSNGISYNGASLCAALYETDFALVRLFQNLSSNLSLTWLGWDKSGQIPTNGVGIHHPQGDLMKISFEYDAFSSFSIFGGTSYFWWLNYDDGVIAHGSSGSPILNEQKRVVGQLRGNSYYNPYLPYCSQPHAEYGKFNFSWTGGGHDYDRLSNWLDPIGTNQTTIDSYNPICISGSSHPCDNPVYSVTNLPTGYSVDWSLSPDISILGTSILTTDIPQQNQCTIDSYDLVPWATSLRADVKNATGDTIVTLSKVIRNTFDVTFTQTGGTIGGVTYPSIGPSTVSSTGTIAVNHRCGVSVESPFFDDMTISHSGASPSFFGVFDGSINFVFPTVASTQYMTITGRDGCRIMQLNVQVIPNPNIPIPMLEISPTANGYEIQLVWVGDDDAVRERTRSVQNTVWELNIVNAASGEAVECLRVKGDRTTISTTGWKPGAYVLQAFIDGQKTTKKMLVK